MNSVSIEKANENKKEIYGCINEWWKLFRTHDPIDQSDEWWEQLHKEAMEIYDKYKKTPQRYFCASIGAAILVEMQAVAKGKRF